MKDFQLYEMPNPSVVGSVDKWFKSEVIKAKNRRSAVLQLKGDYWTETLKEKQKPGTGIRTFIKPFKLRLI